MAKKKSVKSKSVDPAINCHRKHNVAIAILVSGAMLLALAFFLVKIENDTLESETTNLEQQYTQQNDQVQQLEGKVHSLEANVTPQPR